MKALSVLQLWNWSRLAHFDSFKEVYIFHKPHKFSCQSLLLRAATILYLMILFFYVCEKNGSCDSVILRMKDEEDPTSIPSNKTGNAFVSIQLYIWVHIPIYNVKTCNNYLLRAVPKGVECMTNICLTLCCSFT